MGPVLGAGGRFGSAGAGAAAARADGAGAAPLTCVRLGLLALPVDGRLDALLGAGASRSD